MHALDEQRLGRREAMGVLDATALLEHQWGVEWRPGVPAANLWVPQPLHALPWLYLA